MSISAWERQVLQWYLLNREDLNPHDPTLLCDIIKLFDKLVGDIGLFMLVIIQDFQSLSSKPLQLSNVACISETGCIIVFVWLRGKMLGL